MIGHCTVAVVIPCYRVSLQILDVVAAIGPEVDAIFVVDDACPEQSGHRVEDECAEPRVRVLRHAENRGVGGAMVTGYRAALAGGHDIVVKIDGDGQMNPALIPAFARPLAAGAADYAKGNRFFWLEGLVGMPRLRLLGNATLSFVAKAATGYWDVMDPTNGYTAIHRAALEALPLDKLDRGYFFESDMLFRLYTVRAVVRDIPMRARYANETSSLSLRRAATGFPGQVRVALLEAVLLHIPVARLQRGKRRWRARGAGHHRRQRLRTRQMAAQSRDRCDDAGRYGNARGGTCADRRTPADIGDQLRYR